MYFAIISGLQYHELSLSVAAVNQSDNYNLKNVSEKKHFTSSILVYSWHKMQGQQ